MPKRKPEAAGRKARVFRFADDSRAGIRRLQTDAATITPAAKPERNRTRVSLREEEIKNTQAEPRAVPISGIKIPFNISYCKKITVYIILDV